MHPFIWFGAEANRGASGKILNTRFDFQVSIFISSLQLTTRLIIWSTLTAKCLLFDLCLLFDIWTLGSGVCAGVAALCV